MVDGVRRVDSGTYHKPICIVDTFRGLLVAKPAQRIDSGTRVRLQLYTVGNFLSIGLFRQDVVA